MIQIKLYLWNVLVVFLFVSQIYLVATQRREHPYDNQLSIINLVRNQGYPIEIHTNIQTEDGYLLDMHRIPFGKMFKDAETQRPPVLVLHGLSQTSEIFVSTENGLGFLLADSGFDVWLGNFRGNKYSRKHVRLDPLTDRAYSNYSWHEKGVYDLPTKINYILNLTVFQRIYYIGHSEGTTAGFVLLSEKPEFNRIVRLMVALAPSVYLNHTNNPFIRDFIRYVDVFADFFKTIGVTHFYLPHELPPLLGQILCGIQIFKEFCSFALHTVLNMRYQEFKNFQISPSDVVRFSLHGITVNEVLHYSQIIRADTFSKFDYGVSLNKLRYDSVVPPRYDLSKVWVPVALIYAVNDMFTNPLDIRRLKKELPNVVFEHEIMDASFKHLDYLWRMNVSSTVYQELIDLLRRHSL